MSELPLPDPPLRSATLALRAWRTTDVAAVIAASADPAIARFAAPIGPHDGEADARAWLAGREPARIAGLRLDLAIVGARSGQVIGSIALSHAAQHRRATVSFWVAPQARGRGVATEAVRLGAAWAFERLGLQRLELYVEPENVASLRVTERCGFSREGLLRSHFVRHGERRDVLVYGLLAEEWRSSTRSSSWQLPPHAQGPAQRASSR